MQGLLLAVLIVAAGSFVLGVIERHAEEHGHKPACAVFDVKCAQRRAVDDRQGADRRGHADIVRPAAGAIHVQGGQPWT